MSVAARTQPPDHLSPFSPSLGIDGLVAEGIGIRRLDRQRCKLCSTALPLLLQKLLGSDIGDIVLQLDKAIQPRLQRRVVHRQLLPPHAIGLFDAHRVHRAHAHHRKPVLLPLCRQRVEQRVLRFDRMMQLPAQLSHKVHAQGVDVLLSRHRDVLGAQPREGFVGKIGIRQCRKKVARARSAQNKSATLQSVVDKP